MAALFAFLHHVSAFTLFAALVVEFVLIRGTLTLENARKIQRADMIFGISAGVLLLVGLARVFYFEKGATYYFHTWTFHAKLSLFVIVGLISIIPTMEFLRWRTAVKAGQVPAVSAREDQVDPLDHPLRDGWRRADHSLRRADGEGHRAEDLIGDTQKKARGKIPAGPCRCSRRIC